VDRQPFQRALRVSTRSGGSFRYDVADRVEFHQEAAVPDKSVSRRYFFFGSVLAGAVPAAGYGSVPSLRALGYKPYYDKLNVAAIGCGGRGGEILKGAARTENIVALCDVDERRAAETSARYAGKPKYKDFRVMLDKEARNIDACTIGVPDFMHATVALACMQRGKHVYVEKPLKSR